MLWSLKNGEKIMKPKSFILIANKIIYEAPVTTDTRRKSLSFQTT